MKQKRTFITLLLVIALLCLGIAYAAMSGITLTVNGSASSKVTDDNFIVKFTGTPTVSNETNVNAKITDDKTATMDVTGLVSVGDKETATYTITNASVDLDAELIANINNSNTEYFTVTCDLTDKKLVEAEGETTITITTELIKVPINEDVSSTITVTIEASPVQPTV